MTKERRNPLGWVLDNPWQVVFIAIFVLFCFWVVQTRSTEHKVRASFDSAFNLVPGLAISVDGLEVGKIGAVEYDGGKALVEIGINDEKFWPLHQGTKVVSRWGTTIGSGTRRLDLVPGPVTNPEIKENGIIPTADTQPAVDVDLVLNALNGDVRKSLKSWQAGMVESFDGKEQTLNRALEHSDEGGKAAGDLMTDLATDTFALQALIRNGRRTTNALASREGAVRDLVTVAARTFETFAANTRGTQESISELPATLEQTRSSLRRVDGSIDNLDRLVTSLRPGAKALRPLAAIARPAFRDLRRTVPTTVSTLRTGTSAAPKIDDLLVAATPFMQRGAGVFGDLAPMVGCIRPYAPELGGALVGLATAHQTYDLKNGEYLGEAQFDPTAPPQYGGRKVTVNGQEKIVQYGLRAMPQASSSSLNLPLDSKTYVDAGLKKYAFPRPPGYSAGKPWFIEECGYTPDTLDASKDPEAPSNMAKGK
jgi:ABC-type transporter Mla subunit MlaD